MSLRYESSLGLCDNDHTEKYTIQLIRRLFTKFNACVIATRADFSIFEGNSGATSTAPGTAPSTYSSYKKWQTFVNLKIDLEISKYMERLNDEQTQYENAVQVVKKFQNKLTIRKLDRETKTLSYFIDNSGFKLEAI